MKKTIYRTSFIINYPFYLLIITSILLLSCKVTLVVPYDEVIDNGLKEYKEEINTFIKSMGDLSGTNEGTYNHNKLKYNYLESKIDVLIDRASIQSTTSCQLIEDVSNKIQKVMGQHYPAGFATVEKKREVENGNSYSCIKKLLELIRQQQDLIEQTHSSTDTCLDSNGNSISCIRTTTSNSILKIINQSIDAAWVVETAKKNLK